MRFCKAVEEFETTGRPLCEQAGDTTIKYVKYDFSQRGEGFPVESFTFYDPTEFPNREFARYSGGFEGSIDILINDDGSIYPQVSIIQGNKSYSIWDGKKRRGTSGLDLLKMEELDKKQKSQVSTILALLEESLPYMIDQNPNNPTFKSCAEFFGLNPKTADYKSDNSLTL